MRLQPFVQPKADRRERKQRPFNEAALAAMGLATPLPSDPARKVVIGFVDYGFDLLHPCLLDAAGKRSRFACFWDQNASPAAARTAGLDVGGIADWDAHALNGHVADALAAGSRRALDTLYDPHANNCGSRGTQGGAHGTMMASIAAGTPFADFRGAAPATVLIGVQLALLDHDWKEQDARGRPTWLDWECGRQPVWDGWRSYDEAPQIVNAVRYIYERACRLGADALIINLSIGAWAGAHDGRSPVERGIAAVLLQAEAACKSGRGPLTTVVTGAGNAGVDEGHFAGRVTNNGPVVFGWRNNRKNSEKPTQNKLEIWYECGAGKPLPLAIAITASSNPRLRFEVVPGRTHEVLVDGVRVGIAEHTPSARPGLGRVRVLLYPALFPDGLFDADDDACCWHVSAAAPAGSAPKPVQLHAWIERDDAVNERSTLVPSHPESTLCCLATVPGALVVAGYDHHAGIGGSDSTSLGVMPVSSLGPAPWSADQRPHVCAPGHQIWGARSKSRGFVATSGTSAAVALASGALAAYLHENRAGSDKKVLKWLKLVNSMSNVSNDTDNQDADHQKFDIRFGCGSLVVSDRCIGAA